jgi:DNA polymerase
MGWKKFQATVAKAPYFVTVTDEMADRAIRAYRETYAEVPRFWYGVQDAAIRAVQEPRVPHDYRGIRFVADAAWLLCRLPSGRVLTYPRPDVRPHPTPWGEERPALFAWGENSVTRQWEEYSLYGGLLTENIVQAIARDLLADAMLRLDAAGEAIVLHAHDEIVCETPDPARTLAAMTSIMQSPPTWGRDIPVAVETWTDFRYRK